MKSLKPCYHCGLPVPQGSSYLVNIKGTNEAMCCPGCQAVAQTIMATGLTDYYQYRTSVAFPAKALQKSLIDELRLYDRPDIQLDFVTVSDSGESEALLIIEGITCAACIWLIENQLAKLDGLSDCSVNLSNGRARVTWLTDSLELSEILQSIYRIGYKVYPFYPAKQDALIQSENRLFIRRLGVAGIAMMQVMMFAIALYAGAFEDMGDEHRRFLRWVSLLLTTPVVLYAAQPFFIGAWRNLKTRHLSMDLPVSLAISSAYLASFWSTVSNGQEIYFDSVVMFTFFLLLGRYLEFRARIKLDHSTSALSKLLPQTATLINGAQQQTIALRDLNPGDHILVKTGQIIPADGLVVNGRSSIDESQLTGEFMPQRKGLNDKVVAGSMNLENPIRVEVTHVAGQTRLSGVLRLLDQARASKPPIAIMADKVAQYFVAGVLLVAVSVAFAWWLIDPEKAFWVTLSVLVVTCPCALSLATPTALTAATAYLARLGFLVSHGHTLEGLAQATHIIFDKTGTLTRGRLTLQEILVLGDSSKHDCYQIAAAIEAYSEHPIANAFEDVRIEASNICIATGQGVQGTVRDKIYRLGTPEFVLKPSGRPAPPLPASDANDSTQWVLLGDESSALAWFQLNDEIRPNCCQVISDLQQMGFEIGLLSGDFSGNVKTIANQLGIEQAIANASPHDKMRHIQSLQNSGKKVVMVGDGINDIPVLAAADISIAMTNASDLTKTSADAILLSGDLRHLIDVFDCAYKCRRIIKQNIGWAILYNLLALPLAATGFIAPYLAAIGMSSSSLLVVINALRLNKVRQPCREHEVK